MSSSACLASFCIKQQDVEKYIQDVARIPSNAMHHAKEENGANQFK